MTTKQYRTAMGKTVDMGAIILQNENTRAVGNMAVNARGDRIDTNNRIIDKKSNQIKRQHKKQTVSAQLPATTSNASLKRDQLQETLVDTTDTFEDLSQDDNNVTKESAEPINDLKGGLAAAIAKAKTVQQTKLATPRETAKQSGVRKI